jgi:hypothetical protein
MCAQRRDKQQEESASPTSEQLASVDLEKTEGTETQDAASQPEFALVLDDEVKLLLEKLKSGVALLPEEEMKINLAEQQGLISSNGNLHETETDDAQDVVQTQAVDAQETVQSLGDEIPTLEPPHADIVEVLAVTSKSEAGFYRAGLKFERLNAIPVEVLADGSGLVGDYPLTISQVQAIRNEPHLKCELVHYKVTM